MADRNAPATFTFEQWRTEFNELATDVGDIANLPATINGGAVTDVIEAISALESGLSSVLLPTVIDFDDSTGVASERIKFGTDDDLQMYHDGSHSYVAHNGTGDLLIDSNNNLELDVDGNIDIDGDGTVSIDGASGVTIQYNNSTKIEATNTGVSITGNIVDGSGTMTGNLAFPVAGGRIGTEGFAIAVSIALG